MTSALGGSTWPEVADRAAALLAVPLGSLEQHGPHLPLDTDTRIAVALAAALAAARPDVVVAPAVAYGASGEHAAFPGTLSIGTAALTTVLVELGRSADVFTGVVFVNGHGGNLDAVRAAASTLSGEGRRVLAWSPSVPGGDAHAGRTETSILLALDPSCVRLDRAAPGATAPLPELIGELRRGGVAAVAANGVLGDPAGASAAEGHDLLAQLGDALRIAVDARFGR
ncbi:MAG TPA: mycofactocin biosynthesis peptidyl-dipeptidase MftE [Phycicoccus sp.]|nr:mycofactocin biosynthesis peptidyl-dipeptidase MftE [Phycicoccus sp.]